MTNDDSKSTPNQSKTKLWVDILIFIAFLILAVNTSGMIAPDLRGNGESRPEFRPQDGDADGSLPFARESEREGGGSRFMLGMIKNVVVITVLVLVIIWPKNIARKESVCRNKPRKEVQEYKQDSPRN